MTLSQTAINNRTRDIQQDGNRLTMTPVQLERAALRIAMKTRISNGDSKAGVADRGDDAALVAIAYLDQCRELREPHNYLHTVALKAKLAQAEDKGIELKMHPSIQLSSGVYYDFLNPWDTPISIEDIASGLSRVCRYTGQLGTHVDEDDVYTVAQHSVLASENCEPGHEFAALMHDATEAVMNDMASPLKQLLPCYKAIEERNEAAIFQTFGLPHHLSPEVKKIDLIMLGTEKRDLMPRGADDDRWVMLQGVEPLNFTIKPWRPSEARARFLARYAFLTQGVFPKPGDRYATPHPNAPAAYIEAYESNRRAFPDHRFGVPSSFVTDMAKVSNQSPANRTHWLDAAEAAGDKHRKDVSDRAVINFDSSDPIPSYTYEPTGRTLYNRYVDSSGIHCNRMRGWPELTEEEQTEWEAKAALVRSAGAGDV